MEDNVDLMGRSRLEGAESKEGKRETGRKMHTKSF
jgi:hypothetical protein